ncbi:MAG TPA: hypothetical protein VIM65_20070 [Cyclobacteriaceae bacterium]
MKKLIFLFVCVAWFGCSKNDYEIENQIKSKVDAAGNAVTLGQPTWITGYPNIAYGAVSVDINLKTDVASKVYWVVSTKALTLTTAELKIQAVSPTNDAIKFHGTTTLTANVSKLQTVKGLAQHTRYYTYVVAQTTTTSAILQAVPTNLSNFITHYRQDTGYYQSAAENRKVLYLIYRPEEVLKYKKKYPILFFLGGNGEVATSTKPINYYNFNRTLPEYIKNGNDVPMIVLTIQHVVKTWNVALIDEGVNHGLKTYPVDTRKVYMSGCSGGGFGTWNYSVAHPDKLAAIVPISGGGSASKACNLKNVSIWAFHNAIDGIVPSSNSQRMIDAVKSCSPTKQVKLTYFYDIDGKAHHDCWRRVFNKNDKDWSKTPDMPRIDIYAWLLTKSL